ncbi:MAG TPA: CRISPR-associated endonuclease Cas2 [Bacteroidales bacterium]|nr:CRISPR-associated endonuclease Cas2 [Bacteroidales bacterium]
MKKTDSPEVSFLKLMERLRKAGLSTGKIVQPDTDEPEPLEELHERIRKILGIFGNLDKKVGKMIYFIMYDIENNKVRNYIAKYLTRKGCTRVQKSIFIANTERKLYDEIQGTLKKVQDMYDNRDSIFFVPVSVDEIRAMKIIGQSIDFDLVTGSKNTLFF